MKFFTILLVAFVVVGVGCVSQSNETPTPPAGNTRDTETVPEAGMGTTPEKTSDVVNVDIEGLSFVPSTITLTTGQTLHFTNNSGFAHDVHVTKNGADVFPRTQINAGESLDVTITEAGTYELICDRHAPGMAGSIEAN